MGALYRPKKKGHPTNLTHEKTTQNSSKYKSDSMHVSGTKLKKGKGKFLGSIRPQQADTYIFQDLQNQLIIFVGL